MLKRIILLPIKLLLVGAVLLLPSAHALDIQNSDINATPEIPVEIQSDSAEFDDKQGKATYIGHVIMEQGPHQVRGDSLVIVRDKQGKIESMLASGLPAYFTTKPDDSKSPITGNAKEIEYFPKQHKIHFYIEALITQNGDTIKGDSLIYDLESRVLVSTPVPGKQTTILLSPKEN